MTVLSQQDRTSLIRYQNDLFRQTFTGGVVTITSGIAALCEEVRADMIRAPRAAVADAQLPENVGGARRPNL